jgi:hypothetical protein
MRRPSLISWILSRQYPIGYTGEEQKPENVVQHFYHSLEQDCARLACASI